MSGEKTIEQVLAEHTDRWMEIPGVEGTAIGLHNNKPCILILTSVDSDQLRPQVPHVVQGFPVMLEATGEVQALGSE